MTSLAVQLSVDSRGPCALYIATDSRITWASASSRWDSGQKAFACRLSADIYGFCGDAYFPPMLISQLVTQIECEVLFNGVVDGAERHRIWLEQITRSFRNSTGLPKANFIILHGLREGEGMRCRCRLWRTAFDSHAENPFDNEVSVISDFSCFATIDGSGKSVLESELKRNSDSSMANTSRGAMQSFYRALKSGQDRNSGGAPQLVGVWRVGPARYFGSIWNGKRYLCGSELETGSKFKNLMWFGDLFEVYDGDKIKRARGAKKHERLL